MFVTSVREEKAPKLSLIKFLVILLKIKIG